MLARTHSRSYTRALPRDSESSSEWRELARLAVKGLQTVYGSAGLPHTVRLDDGQPRLVGHNVRYALISLIGLAQAKHVVDVHGGLAALLRKRVERELAQEPLALGDWGLLLWARALDSGLWENTPRFAWESSLALQVHKLAPQCDSVELAWLSIGAGMQQSGDFESIGHIAFEHLTKLFGHDSSLFARHSRSGVLNGVSGRVACFANQVYPLLALSYRALAGCENSMAMVEAILNKLLSLQGPLGQWWWLYDSENGKVVDRYPVFSVHQDGMAPMALLAASRALDRDLHEVIAQTVRWIHGHNELQRNMMVEEHGLILRDIHPRGAGRLTRMAKAAVWCAGWQRQPQERGADFVINRECRPYHLGWVLYAAGLALLEQSGGRLQHVAEEVGV